MMRVANYIIFVSALQGVDKPITNPHLSVITAPTEKIKQVESPAASPVAQPTPDNGSFSSNSSRGHR